MDKNKGLPELISEMLIKQDRTDEILEEFMAVSVKQWDQQAKFNERFFDKLEKLPPHVLAGIKKGKEDIKAGDIFTYKEFKQQLSISK